MNQGLMDKFRKVKALILDFDGVLTDGCVFVDSEEGREMVRCSHYDGMGIKMVRQAGIKVVVVSGQISSYVKTRCKKMGISFICGVNNKAEAVKRLIDLERLDSYECVFMGDDLNDIEAIKISGIIPIAVANAVPEVKKIAVYITAKKGGEGAVREVCDLILKAKGEALK
ncbi:MAG: HAD-IIIA family hydrolase [Candidatus Azambacteria bacterium]|nr:HAD-IIIA family hydrolase [Candidatus Azambacteria bacterium]